MASFSFSPSSSPSSSPLLCPDSSPPSSPGLEPLYLSDADTNDLPPVIADPLAGSFKATKTPPQYEKHVKRRRPNIPHFTVTPKKPRHHAPTQSPRVFTAPRSDPFDTTSPTQDMEEAIWDAAVERAMETGVKRIDLMGCQLTRIPKKFVTDLEKIVVLPTTNVISDVNARLMVNAAASRRFGRVHTAPASADVFRSPDASDRALSIGHLPLTGLTPNCVQIYLSGNNISQLPVELWGLRNLTVLSLRGNLLWSIPPEIARLTNLRNLNISNNRLTYLPAEMLEMELKEVCIHPNPFLQPPSPSRSLDKQVSEMTAMHDGRVPSLSELCLRTLLSRHASFLSSPAIVQEPRETILAALYDLPFSEDFRDMIPPHLRATIEACVPGSINTPDIDTLSPLIVEERPTGIGICSNPKHRAERRVFIHAAECRFTWESKIAGQPAGGAVPVRWRGCLKGCLDFLSGADEEDTLVDDNEVVKTVVFASGDGGFGDDDFDF